MLQHLMLGKMRSEIPVLVQVVAGEWPVGEERVSTFE